MRRRTQEARHDGRAPRRDGPRRPERHAAQVGGDLALLQARLGAQGVLRQDGRRRGQPGGRLASGRGHDRHEEGARRRAAGVGARRRRGLQEDLLVRGLRADDQDVHHAQDRAAQRRARAQGRARQRRGARRQRRRLPAGGRRRVGHHLREARQDRRVGREHRALAPRHRRPGDAVLRRPRPLLRRARGGRRPQAHGEGRRRLRADVLQRPQPGRPRPLRQVRGEAGGRRAVQLLHRLHQGRDGHHHPARRRRAVPRGGAPLAARRDHEHTPPHRQPVCHRGRRRHRDGAVGPPARLLAQHLRQAPDAHRRLRQGARGHPEAGVVQRGHGLDGRAQQAAHEARAGRQVDGRRRRQQRRLRHLRVVCVGGHRDEAQRARGGHRGGVPHPLRRRDGGQPGIAAARRERRELWRPDARPRRDGRPRPRPRPWPVSIAGPLLCAASWTPRVVHRERGSVVAVRGGGRVAVGARPVRYFVSCGLLQYVARPRAVLSTTATGKQL
mmetsp:Transcript_27648/g.70047  ORF Transcript_27648/g.70047 Transcript_27648/m.70047 type:complete len:499 (+) Transcript_27648:453-1949(+)